MNSHLNFRTSFSFLSIITVLFSVSACSLSSKSEQSASALLLPTVQQNRYLASGSIILSRQLPAPSENMMARASAEARPMAPIIGYVPPAKDFLPAVNETWLQIDRMTREMTVYRGKEKLKVVKTTGIVPLSVGSYIIQAKQNQPLWNAPDNYFMKRNLPLPENTQARNLRGALGSQALFASENFAIHSAPFYTEEVGGLRIADADMQSIYALLSVGSAVVVQ